jgi:hypothetical protein
VEAADVRERQPDEHQRDDEAGREHHRKSPIA